VSAAKAPADRASPAAAVDVRKSLRCMFLASRG
jgi:hypothetical protein